jgi:hypothetical protein
MSTGKIYTLSADSTDYIVVNQYDITSGADSILGAIYEPGIMGIIADATGFNSNQGILYYVGIDGSNALNLFSIDVRSTVFSYTKTLVITPNFGNNIQSVNYDNVHDKLFAMNSVYDSSFTFQGSYVVEIDLLTGIIQNRGLLEGFVGFVVGSSSFDQNSSSLLLIGLTANNNLQMIVFNTLTNTYITGFVPSGVSEVVCDNTNFASNAYVTKITALDKPASLQLYPNPAVHQLVIQLPGDVPLNQSARIFDLNGRAIFEIQLVERTTKVDISNLKPGNYLLKYHAETLRFSKL